MDELGVEIVMKDSFKKKLVRRMLTRADHVERTEDKKLPKRADARNVQGKGGEVDRNCNGGLCKRDLERVGEEWRKEQQIEGIGDY